MFFYIKKHVKIEQFNMNDYNLDIDNLNEGDIILSKSNKPFSELVLKVCGGNYSHACIYVGDGMIIHPWGSNKTFEEAKIIYNLNNSNVFPNIINDKYKIRNWCTKILSKAMKSPRELNGLIIEPLNRFLHDREYTDVFRFHKNGSDLGGECYPVEPILEIAKKYLEQRPYFPFDHLVLGTINRFIRKIPAPYHYKILLRFIIDNLMHFLHKCLPFEKNRIGCSSFVSKIFNEADPSNKYTLEIPGHTWSNKFVNTMNEYIDDLNMNRIRALIWKNIFKGINKIYKYIPHWVSPADLEQSPSLKKIGAINNQYEEWPSNNQGYIEKKKAS